MLFRELELEINRAFCSKWMLISLATGVLLLSLNIITQVISISSQLGSTLDTFPSSLYNRWAGAWGFDPFYQSYMFIIPILAALPYAWSLRDDFDTGYAMQCEAKAGKHIFIFSKMVSIFFSGAVATTLPLLICFAISALFLPAIQPDPSAIGAFTITQSSMWADLFYTNALLYTCFYFGIVFLVSGTIACLSSIIGIVVSNNLITIMSMFFVLVALDAGTRRTSLASFSVMKFLLPQQISPTNPEAIVVFFLISTSLIMGACFYLAKKESGRII